MNRDDPAPSIWLVQELPRKVAKGSIDRDAIAATAAEMLDETGLDSFTMRDLGRRLGLSAMACYAHVRHKDDVLELAQDHVVGRLELREGDWQVILRALAANLKARHYDVDVAATGEDVDVGHGFGHALGEEPRGLGAA